MMRKVATRSRVAPAWEGTPVAWECGNDRLKQGRFEAWTNAQLDQRESDWRGAFTKVLFERVKFIAESNELTDPDMQRLLLLDAEKRKDPILGAMLALPGMRDTYNKLHERGRPKGKNKGNDEKKAQIALARVLVRLVNDIWKSNFNVIQRGGNPPTAAQIVRDRLLQRYKMRIDPHSIGAI